MELEKLCDRLEKRKDFRDLNIFIDRENKKLMHEIKKVFEHTEVLKNEAKIKNLALLISSKIYKNLADRFITVCSLPAAPSRKRIELLYVDTDVVDKKYNELMKHKKKKRKYTLKQFFGKPEFKKRGLKKENITSEQIKELSEVFIMLFNEKDKHVSQSDLWILFDFVMDKNRELNYTNRLIALRKLKGKQSTGEYKCIRHGVEEGLKKYNKFVSIQSNNNSAMYYKNKFGEKEGIDIWNTLNNKRREKTKFNWSVDGFKLKYGKNWKEEKIKWEAKLLTNLSKVGNVRSASKSSLSVFLPVLDYFKDSKLDYQIGFEDNEEFLIKKWSYDLTIHNLKLIFEFQGKAFHPNPNWSEDKWVKWSQTFSNKSSNEVYKHDVFKKKLAESEGYKVIYIWEEDNVLDNINSCIKIIEDSLIQESN